jgi:hypothetical protein
MWFNLVLSLSLHWISLHWPMLCVHPAASCQQFSFQCISPQGSPLESLSRFMTGNSERDFHRWVSGAFGFDAALHDVPLTINNPSGEGTVQTQHPALAPAAIADEIWRLGESTFRTAFFGDLSPGDVFNRWKAMESESWFADHPHLQEMREKYNDLPPVCEMSP